jgi:hypothetical protein
MIPIIDKNSIEQCKRASFLFGKIIPFYRTVVPMAKRSRFPVSRWLIREEDSLNWMKSELEWMYEQGILVALKKDPDQNDSHFDDFDDEKPCWICHIPHESGTGQTRFFWQMQNDDIDRFDNLNTISKTFVEHPIFYETSSYMHKSPESSNDKRNSVIEEIGRAQV